MEVTNVKGGQTATFVAMRNLEEEGPGSELPYKRLRVLRVGHYSGRFGLEDGTMSTLADPVHGQARPTRTRPEGIQDVRWSEIHLRQVQRSYERAIIVPQGQAPS
jgi:hypothetical protein